MRLHVIAPFHTVPNAAHSHCAFTSRGLGLVNMMAARDHEVFEYANAGSESRATNRVEMLSAAEYAEHFPAIGENEMHDKHANLGSDGWKLFNDRCRAALTENVKPSDIVLHCFDNSHYGFLRQFPDAIHVSPFVGNGTRPFGTWRIYESEAWRHYCFGRFETMRDPYDGMLLYAGNPSLSRNYSWVIPNARDANEWPLGEGRGDYVLFMGRIFEQKGTDRIAEIIRMWDRKHPDDGLRFLFAGQGDFDAFASLVMKGDASLAKRIEYLGSVHGTARAALVGDARVMLCPTKYVEPGGGSAIESMLCGTPVLASAWGCFTESVLHGLTGYQCRTMADWIAGIEWAGKLSRRTICQVARERHSFDAVAPQFEQVFRQLILLSKDEDVPSLSIP